MERAYITMVDGQDFNFEKSFDLAALFPDHYYPTVSSDRTQVEINLVGGETRFIFGEGEVECFFEFYEADDELYEEEQFEDHEASARSLVEFVSVRISDVTGRETEVGGV